MLPYVSACIYFMFIVSFLEQKSPELGLLPRSRQAGGRDKRFEGFALLVGRGLGSSDLRLASCFSMFIDVFQLPLRRPKKENDPFNGRSAGWVDQGSLLFGEFAETWSGSR